MQKIKLKTEESGKKLLAAYAPPKWSETADDDDDVFLFLAPVWGSTPAEPYPNPFSIRVGQSKPLLNLTWPKIGINFMIFNNPYKNIYK